LLASIQKSTLAGFRALDARGTVVAGRDEIGLSLAHVPEVADALAGRYTSVIRVRETDEPPPPLYSISRGTRIRVFVAVPVLLNDRVAGVVYVSRTPNHILRHLYGERGKVALWVAFVLAGTALAGLMLMRMVTRPVNALLDRTVRISAGDRSALQALETNGTREMAALADGLLSMAGRLQERSDYIRSFASHVSHELKSPLTAISGAAELLRDQGATMSDSERARFAANIAEDAVRLDRLVARLRDHARAETAIAGSEATRLADAVASMAAPEGIAIEMRIPTDMSVAMSAETIGIVLANLADNAASHGTKTLTFAARAADGRATITVSDDGTGISPGNRGRVFEPFFTTRREEGGTGMGLHIVKTLIEAHGGSIRLLDVAKGAAFEITLPLGA
jgi:signal transduction histidine kinase